MEWCQCSQAYATVSYAAILFKKRVKVEYSYCHEAIKSHSSNCCPYKAQLL